MADLPVTLSGPVADRLSAALDVEGKIVRALDALGPVADRDVALVDAADGVVAGRLESLGARVQPTGPDAARPWAVPEGSADAVVALWSAFRGLDPEELAEARRVARPGGRLLVVHDYGRDDVSRLYDADSRPEYGEWSRRDGPFLANGFKVRVVHCWWTFDSIEDAQAVLTEGFGDHGRAMATELRRPRLSYNVAVYHRSLGEAQAARR